MSQTEFDFGHRIRVKINLDGIEKEVVNVKGAVMSVKKLEEALEIVIHPEANPQLKPFRFYGESPIQRLDYASVGIILGEKNEGLREALYVILENRNSGYAREVHRSYKRGYTQNPADDKKLGLSFSDLD